MEKDILVIGAGLTGLSCAYKLEQKKANYLLIEKETWTGGLAHSFFKDGFSFDYSGHLLHLRWDETKNFVLNLLKDNKKFIKRFSQIYIFERFVDYPFQINLYNLPENIKSKCVTDFLKARKKEYNPSIDYDFKTWCIKTFGKSISKYFMLPYNQKLWQYPLDKLTTDWIKNFVPIPKIEDVIKGAYSKKIEKIGYNYNFYYPEYGGIGALSKAIESKVKNISLDSMLLSIDPIKKIAKVKNLGEIKYKKILSTIPLRFLIEKIEGAPDTIRDKNKLLRYNQLYILNLGIKKANFSQHWIYFPEKKFPFYRLGFYNNFSEKTAPKNCSSMYIEIATPAGEFIDLNKLEKTIIKKLIEHKFIKSENDLITSMWLKIPCAYVIYDKDRRKILPELFEYLNKNNIYTAGRYGLWKYSFMEENIKEGLESAEMLLKS